MMTDIVEKLLENDQCISDIGCNGDLMRQAADEIERLRAELVEERRIVNGLLDAILEHLGASIKYERMY